MTVRLASIDLYPIKSLDAVAVDEVRILPAGCLEQDRRFAMFDEAGKVINGKRTPLVHRLKLTFSSTFEEVTLTDRRDGTSETYPLSGDRQRLEARLSEHFGMPVFVRENAVTGFPDDTIASGPTVIAAETLASVGNWFDVDFDESKRRFRANLVVEGGGPFWDDRLFAAPGDTVTFRIGEVLLFGMNPCARCAVPSRDSATGAASTGFAKQFRALRQQSLPDWSAVDAFDHFYRLAVNTRLFAPSTGGTLRLGDEVEVLDG